jgi:hypothetical protein
MHFAVAAVDDAAAVALSGAYEGAQEPPWVGDGGLSQLTDTRYRRAMPAISNGPTPLCRPAPAETDPEHFEDLAWPGRHPGRRFLRTTRRPGPSIVTARAFACGMGVEVGVLVGRAWGAVPRCPTFARVTSTPQWCLPHRASRAYGATVIRSISGA